MSSLRRSVRIVLKRFVGDSRAAAMVEFAIVGAMLMVLVFGMVDYGRYFLLRTNLTNAVREGARYAAVLPNNNSNDTAIETYTRGRISAGATNLGTVTITRPGTAGTDLRVRVALTGYTFTPATFLVIKSAKTISVAAEFRIEQP